MENQLVFIKIVFQTVSGRTGFGFEDLSVITSSEMMAWS